MPRRNQSARGAGSLSRRPDGSQPSGRHGLDRFQVEEIQRARMVAACVQAVAEHGIAGLSVAQIVTRAGVSRRTFYELFADCEDCFLAAFDHCVKRLAERVVPGYQSENRWQDRVRAGLVELLQTLDEDPALARLVFVESLGAGPRALERRARALEPVVTAVDGGRTAPKGVSSASPLAAEGAVGAVSAILHSRLLSRDPVPLVRLTNELMSLLVLPYLGPAATRAELRRPAPRARPKPTASPPQDGDVMKALGIRLTYRTLRVLLAIAELPGASNRKIGEHAGIGDQGQISKLLKRLQKLGLIDNAGDGVERGMPNAWRLTAHGEQLRGLIS